METRKVYHVPPVYVLMILKRTRNKGNQIASDVVIKWSVMCEQNRSTGPNLTSKRQAINRLMGPTSEEPSQLQRVSKCLLQDLGVSFAHP